MNNNAFAAGPGNKPVVPDKVDMSLDDIIRLNKKEQLSKRRTTGTRRPVMKKGRLAQTKVVSTKARGPVQRVGAALRGVNKLKNRRVPPAAVRRRGQRVMTGLAARRQPSNPKKGVNPMNRLMQSSTTLKLPLQQKGQKSRPFIRRDAYRPEAARRPYRQPELRRGQSTASSTGPFQLQRRNLPPVNQTQREARQATFIFRRGLEVHTQVQKLITGAAPERTRQWHTLTSNSGILTVSIDNPTAMAQPEPPTLWSLHPLAVSAVTEEVEAVEKKAPKGVSLQFDINSVGKPTVMTLNERFRIMKDKRTATARSNKGIRFVTVE